MVVIYVFVFAFLYSICTFLWYYLKNWLIVAKEGKEMAAIRFRVPIHEWMSPLDLARKEVCRDLLNGAKNEMTPQLKKKDPKLYYGLEYLVVQLTDHIGGLLARELEDMIHNARMENLVKQIIQNEVMEVDESELVD